MIIAEVLAYGLTKALLHFSSFAHGAFVHGRQILNGALVANEGVESFHKERKS